MHHLSLQVLFHIHIVVYDFFQEQFLNHLLILYILQPVINEKITKTNSFDFLLFFVHVQFVILIFDFLVQNDQRIFSYHLTLYLNFHFH